MRCFHTTDAARFNHLLGEISGQHFKCSKPDDPLFWYNYGNPNEPVLGERHLPMTYNALRMVLKKVAKRGGLKKEVYPYLFSHSIITRYSRKLSSAMLEQLAGWRHGSGRAGRIDLVARKGKFRVAVEYDHHELIKWKSFQKIMQIKPSVAIGITGSGSMKPNFDRALRYKDRIKSLLYVVSLTQKKYEVIKPVEE